MAGDLYLSQGTVVDDQGSYPAVTFRNTLTLFEDIDFEQGAGYVGEDFSFGPGEMRTAATLVTTNSFPRYQMPATGTTSILLDPYNFPAWWLATDIHIAHVNDHSATGNVRLRTIVREIDVGTESLTSGATILDSTATFASAAANGGLTIAILTPSMTLTRGLFGSIYTFELQRLGDDGADTLGGPFSLGAVGFIRQ